MKSRSTSISLTVALTLGLCAFATGCSSDGDASDLIARATGSPVELDGEQVSLTDRQISCGAANDLWEDAASSGGQSSVYRLTPKGRELKFSDDIYLDNPEYHTAYTQVRGKFLLNMPSVLAIHDGPEAGTKLIQSPLGIKIAHVCFPAPLPLMGVSKGKFTTSVAPTLLFENSETGWMPKKLLH